MGTSIRYFSDQNDPAVDVTSEHKDDVVPKNILPLHQRGIFQEIYPPASVSLPKKFEKKQCFYCGFDPTADSLHVGNLLSIMALLHCQRAGQLYALLGFTFHFFCKYLTELINHFV